jgi:tRNA U34 5-methylaminomethyl-2-thiouridine-forming methyltransferase MnmC
MGRKMITTGDGSHSIEILGTNEFYHSKFGAIQESVHVFIEAGLKPLMQTLPTINIFEMGFGTGLNALLTLVEAEKHQQKIYYETIELFPLEEKFTSSLNYCEQLQRQDLKKIFELLHSSEWDNEIIITPYFSFKKIKTSLIDCQLPDFINLIYYDAFAPNTQPDLWQKEIFEKLFNCLLNNGILVTYCSKGAVKRAMKAAGFFVEKLQGSPGKREMARATKITGNQ